VYSVDGREVSFSLEKEGQLVVTGNDLHQCLYLYYTKPISCPNPEDISISGIKVNDIPYGRDNVQLDLGEVENFVFE